MTAGPADRAFGPAITGRYYPPKLTPKQRDDIVRRLADGESPQALAAEYGVAASTIRAHRR